MKKNRQVLFLCYVFCFLISVHRNCFLISTLFDFGFLSSLKMPSFYAYSSDAATDCIYRPSPWRHTAGNGYATSQLRINYVLMSEAAFSTGNSTLRVLLCLLSQFLHNNGFSVQNTKGGIKHLMADSGAKNCTLVF